LQQFAEPFRRTVWLIKSLVPSGDQAGDENVSGPLASGTFRLRDPSSFAVISLTVPPSGEVLINAIFPENLDVTSAAAGFA
jgi:hypothetical protein